MPFGKERDPSKGHEGSPDWYRTAFGVLYPVLYAHRDDASAGEEIRKLLVALNLGSAPLDVLDVCCGAGRHTQALAGHGHRVTGFDLSPQLLETASRRASLRGRLVRADMRALPFRPAFDLALNLFTSFGYFETDRENAAALAEMARVLRPGGMLVMDHMNREATIRDLVPEDRMRKGRYTLIQRRTIEGDRVVKAITLADREEPDAEPLHLLESVRLYRPAEMAALFEAAGLERLFFMGGFSGEPFAGDSTRMIVSARKRV